MLVREGSKMTPPAFQQHPQLSSTRVHSFPPPERSGDQGESTGVRRCTARRGSRTSHKPASPLCQTTRNDQKEVWGQRGLISQSTQKVPDARGPGGWQDRHLPASSPSQRPQVRRRDSAGPHPEGTFPIADSKQRLPALRQLRNEPRRPTPRLPLLPNLT